MKKLPENLKFRRHIQKRYNKEFPEIMERPPHSETVQYYCARVPAEYRDSLIDYLSTKNIHTSVHFKPLYLYEPLAQNRQYPVCDSEWPKLITLPCHNRMDETDIDYVIYWIKEYFNNI